MSLGDCPRCWDAHCDCPPPSEGDPKWWTAGCQYELTQIVRELTVALEAAMRLEEATWEAEGVCFGSDADLLLVARAAESVGITLSDDWQHATSLASDGSI